MPILVHLAAGALALAPLPMVQSATTEARGTWQAEPLRHGRWAAFSVTQDRNSGDRWVPALRVRCDGAFRMGSVARPNAPKGLRWAFDGAELSASRPVMADWRRARTFRLAASGAAPPLDVSWSLAGLAAVLDRLCG